MMAGLELFFDTHMCYFLRITENRHLHFNSLPLSETY